MLYDCKRISYRIDRRLTGLAGPDYDATISFGCRLRQLFQGVPLREGSYQEGESAEYALTPEEYTTANASLIG